MSNSLNSVWGHSVHSAKFQMLRFPKATAAIFIQFQPKIMESMVIRGIQAITFCDLPNLKILWQFGNFC